MYFNGLNMKNILVFYIFDLERIREIQVARMLSGKFFLGFTCSHS